MNLLTRWVTTVAGLACCVVLISGCAQAPTSAATSTAPAQVEAIGDSGLKKLTLTDKAVSRLSLTTAMVSRQKSNGVDGTKLVMPYAALLYLPTGETFAYTNTEGTSYVRASVTVDSIIGDEVVLSAGPAIGTPVVTQGGTELWGLEFGIK